MSLTFGQIVLVAILLIFAVTASYYIYCALALWNFIYADDSMKHPRAMLYDYKSAEVGDN